MRQFATILNGVYIRSDLEPSHFRIEEFVCHDGCRSCMVDRDLIDTLEKIREAIGNQPIRILSGVRCAAHNKAVGGVSRSQHLPRTTAGVIVPESGTQEGAGRAADIATKGLTPAKLAAIIKSRHAEFGVRGLGVYSGFVHVDVRAGAFTVWTG